MGVAFFKTIIVLSKSKSFLAEPADLIRGRNARLIHPTKSSLKEDYAGHRSR